MKTIKTPKQTNKRLCDYWNCTKIAKFKVQGYLLKNHYICPDHIEGKEEGFLLESWERN